MKIASEQKFSSELVASTKPTYTKTEIQQVSCIQVGIQQAKDAAKSRNWTLALENWNLILRGSPNKLVSLLGKAKALLHLKRFNDAENIYNRIIEQFPDKALGYDGLAQVAAQKQQLELALDRCLSIKSQFPDYVPTQVREGNILLRMGQIDEAEKAFVRIAELYPDAVGAHIGMVRVAMRRQQWQLALQRCSSLVEKYPANVSVRAIRGEILLEIGQLKEAEATFANIAQKYPRSIEGFKGLMRMSMRSEQWKVALQQFEQLQENTYADLSTYVMKGNALLFLEKYEEAEQLFTFLEREYPSEKSGLEGLCRVFQHTKQRERLVRCARQLYKQFSSHTSSCALSINSLIALRHFEEAQTIASNLVEAYPDKPEGLLFSARIAVHQKKWNSALHWFNEVLKKNPDNLDAYRGKINALTRLEDFCAAETEANRAIQIYTDDAPLLGLAARIATITQRWTAIISAIKAYIHKHPEDFQALTNKDYVFFLVNLLLDGLLDSGKIAVAEEIIEALSSANVDSGCLLLWTAHLCRARGYKSIAKQICAGVIEQHPNLADYTKLRLVNYAWQDFDLEDLFTQYKQIDLSAESYPAATVLFVKALFRLDRTEEAKHKLEKLLRHYPDNVSARAILAEIYHFYDKDHISAIKVCDDAIAHANPDVRIYVCKALALSALNRSQEAIALASNCIDEFSEESDRRLLQMVLAQVLRECGEGQQSLETINKWLADGDFLPIRSTGEQCELNVQYLQCNPNYSIDADQKVSVIMTTYKRDDLLPIAIASILNQTYRNIELLIVDDCSPDDTFDFLQEIATTDARIQVLRNAQNAGTYVSKNKGLSVATGEYAAFMDSDDWLHPQTIERQVSTLKNSEKIAAMCGFFRVNTESNIEFKPEGPIGQAHITLCFKRRPVIETLGYFDAARTGADTEYKRRILLKFGRDSIENIVFPLLVSTRHSGSITGGGSLGFIWNGPGCNDGIYAARFTEWHSRIRLNSDSPYMPHPLTERKFDMPVELLP